MRKVSRLAPTWAQRSSRGAPTRRTTGARGARETGACPGAERASRQSQFIPQKESS
jgi:hypothetical protein